MSGLGAFHNDVNAYAGCTRAPNIRWRAARR